MQKAKADEEILATGILDHDTSFLGAGNKTAGYLSVQVWPL